MNSARVCHTCISAEIGHTMRIIYVVSSTLLFGTCVCGLLCVYMYTGRIAPLVYTVITHTHAMTACCETALLAGGGHYRTFIQYTCTCCLLLSLKHAHTANLCMMEELTFVKYFSFNNPPSPPFPPPLSPHR